MGRMCEGRVGVRGGAIVFARHVREHVNAWHNVVLGNLVRVHTQYIQNTYYDNTGHFAILLCSTPFTSWSCAVSNGFGIFGIEGGLCAGRHVLQL